MEASRELCGGGHKGAAWMTAVVWLLLNAGVACFFAARDMTGGRSMWLAATALAGMTGVVGAGLVLGRLAAGRWNVAEGMLHTRRGALLRRETAIRLDRVTCVETCRNPAHSLLGCAKVRIYTAAGRKPAFSLTLRERDAKGLTEAVANANGAEGKAFAKRLAAGKYAALLGALDSRGTLVPLALAALCGVFALSRREWLWIGGGCLAAGTLFFTARLLGESGLSVWLSESGWTLQMGLPAVRRFYLPREAVTGILETRGALALWSGAGRFEILCAGGRRLPCMRWYTGGSGEEASLRLLRCEGITRVRKGSGAAVRFHYGRWAAALLFVLAPTALLVLIRGEMPPAGYLVSAAALPALGQCLMGLRFGEESGLAASSSALRIGGMGMLCARRLTLRRGCLGRLTLRRGLLDRLDGTCAAALRPKGWRSGIVCRALPEAAFGAKEL